VYKCPTMHDPQSQLERSLNAPSVGLIHWALPTHSAIAVRYTSLPCGGGRGHGAKPPHIRHVFVTDACYTSSHRRSAADAPDPSADTRRFNTYAYIANTVLAADTCSAGRTTDPGRAPLPCDRDAGAADGDPRRCDVYRASGEPLCHQRSLRQRQVH